MLYARTIERHAIAAAPSRPLNPHRYRLISYVTERA
jgi:hypothetical protein